MEKLQIIVGGFLGLLPAGGITWDYVQYPLGLSQLGHDVYYIEDTRLYPIYQKPGSDWNDASYAVTHLRQVMDYFGLTGKWAYRDEASGKCFGLPESRVKEICKTADVFINLSCSTFLREEYARIPARALIDSDPMFTQIQYSSEQMFTPGEAGGLRRMIDGHNYLFTFGENIGAAGCRIPTCNLHWHTTRQPVCLDRWKVLPWVPDFSAASFTTLMNWTAGKRLQHRGESWGQKDIEFRKFIHLPQEVGGLQLSAIINQTGGTGEAFPRQEIEAAGWKLPDGESNAGNWLQYRQFIGQSLGEFSVAKETYVKAVTGWFSCRSACYLATGRPVVTQDTGWSQTIPSGTGLLAFTDLESAKEALLRVMHDYRQHARQARAIAEESFDSRKVLTRMLDQMHSSNSPGGTINQQEALRNAGSP